MITSGFFNSVNGDRKYNANHLTKYLGKLVSSGVFPNPSTNLQVVAASGMAVKVSPGMGFIDCQWMDNDSDYTIKLSAASVVYPRIDSIVMQLDVPNRLVTIALKTGTAAASPVAPTVTRTDDIKEYRLADILVGAGVTEITQAEITDTRGGADCGYITGLIQQIDSSTLFAQFQAAFDHWFGQIRNDLTTSTLVREQRDVHISTSQDQVVFEINKNNIPNFVIDLDILDVYVNGLKLTKDIEYTYDANTVTLANGLDLGQQVEIVVFKSVDGYKAESVISQVEDLYRRVLAITPSKQTVTLTTTGWTLTDGYYYQTVQAAILKTVNDVIQVSPAPDSVENYGRVYASEQAVGRLTFKTPVKPAVNLNVNLVNFGVML